MLKKIKLRLFFVAISVIILQATCVPYVAVGTIRPDLFCALFICLLIRHPNINAMYLAYIIGIIKELYSNNFFGLEITSLVIPALFFPTIIKKADIESYPVRVLIIFLFILSSLFVFICSLIITEGAYHIINSLVNKLLGIALYTTITALIMDHIIKICIPRKTVQYELF
ncbi:MAG: hypothetical protein KKH94_04010 [Candidatus Omnitrophica bacterium]|nr:hypothetical protein [Candidatus Omnitrophota bacterium]